MALISTSTFTSGQYVLLGVSSGFPNLRASHSYCIRVKHGSTATNYDSIIADYVAQTYTWNITGGYIGRNNGLASTSINFTRLNDSFSPTVDTYAQAGSYGNTTTWYHLAFVYNATTGFTRTYRDGTYIGQVASTANRPTSSTTNFIAVGAHNGKFADYAFFNRALSDAEVQSMADYRQPQVTSGLLAFWRLDSDATDSSGNGNNGSVSGSSPNVSWSTADNPPQPESPTVAVAGTLATSSSFSAALNTNKPLTTALASSSALAGTLGTKKPVAATLATSSALSAWIRPRWGSRVEVAPALRRTGNTISASSSWTIMTWLRGVNVGASDAVFFSAQSTTAQPILQLYLQQVSGSTNAAVFFADSAGTTVVDYNSGSVGTAWHHLAATNDGTGVIRVYLDGALVVTSSASSISAVTFDKFQYTINGSGVGEFALSKVWSTQLTATEIANEATFFAPYNQLSSLYAWWQISWLDAGLDSSGNGNDLTDLGSTEAQSEAPGLPMAQISGTLATSSAFAPALKQTQSLAGTLASSSSLTGAAIQNFPLSGSLATSSALAGAMVQKYAIAGTLATSSAFAPALGTTKPIAGTLATSSAFSAAVVQAQVLASTLASSSSFSGALAQSFALAGTMASSSAFVGALNTVKDVIGALASSSAFSGALVQSQPVAGAMASSSSFTGLLTVPGAFVGIMQSDSSLSGSLSLAQPLAGVMASSSALAGATQALVAATLVTDSAFVGGLKEAELWGALATDSAFGQAVISIANALVGTLATSSTFAGELQMALAGQMATSSAFSPKIVQLQALGGTLGSVSSFAGALTGGTPIVTGGGGGDPARGRVGVAAGYARRVIR